MADIRWQAPEFEHRPKGALWYWISMWAALILLGIAVWQKNFFFAVFVVIAEILIIVWASVEPRSVLFEINEFGIEVNNKRHSMKELRSFESDIEGMIDPEHPEVVLHFKGHFRPSMRIKVPAKWLPEVRAILRRHIPEEHFDPGFVEILEKFLGF
jgi:hypothetical protein